MNRRQHVSPTTTDYGIAAYLPKPPEERDGIGLSMSGGGFRATLFHLGALRRLNELGILSQVKTIASVSGGSIAAGCVAAHATANPAAWADPGRPVPGFDEGIAEPLRELAGTTIRTKPVLTGWSPLHWHDQNAGLAALAGRLGKLTGGLRLKEVAATPRFVICAADLEFRTQWLFDTGARRMGEDCAGYASVGDWTLARAVAASNAMPIVFRPLLPKLEPKELEGGDYDGPDRDSLVSKIELSDGGLYDNLAVEPIWRDHAVVLASDAAPSYNFEPNLGPVWGNLRYVVTLLEQATNVRKRWLISNFMNEHLEGTYWGIRSLPENYDFDGRTYKPELKPYSQKLIEKFISQVRIDLDAFSCGERAVLENHGYLMAEIAIRRHRSGLVREAAPPHVPWPAWMDEAEVKKALRESHRHKLFARR